MSLYERADYAPLWVDALGRPTAHTRDALGLLHDAEGEGLDSNDYDIE